jgi:hypothetical protein
MPKGTPTSKAPSSIPLRLRLKNPPGAFLGRTAESEWLRAAVERASVALVYGLGGLGKTALVLATLRRSFPERIDRTVMVALSPSDREPERAVARAVAEASGASLEDFGNEPEALLAQVLDLADRSGFWFVIEDAHHGDPERVRAFLGAAATYARAARWIVTSRADAGAPELAGQTLALGAMARGELQELARACAPSLDEVHVDGAVGAAGGSPWRLMQVLRDPSPAAAGDLDVLQGLPATSARFLLDLALVETPFSIELLATFTGVPPAAELRRLEARGLLEPGLAAVRLHDVARGLLRSSAGEARAREIADALAGARDPAAVLESARLSVEAGRVDRAAACVGDCIETLVRSGYAARVFRLFEGASGAETRAIKLRCAMVLGGAAPLAWATALPEPEPLIERLWWAECLHLATKSEAAFEAARAVSAEAEARGDKAVAIAAHLLEARALLVAGLAPRALATLDRADPVTRDDRMRVHALRVRALASAGRIREGLELADRLGGDLEGLASATLRDVELGRLGVFLTSGRARKASEVVERMRARRDAGTEVWVSLNALIPELLIAIEGGQLALARELAPRVGRLVGGVPGLRLYYRWCELRLCFVEGELADLGARIEQATAEALGLGLFRMVHWFRHLELLHTCLTRTPVGPAATSDRPVSESTRLHDAGYERLRAARAGEAWACAEVDVDSLPDIVDLRIVELVANATGALVSNRPERAEQAARRAMELGAEHGFLLWAADARLLLCDALVLRGRGPKLAEELASLEQQAAGFGSRRYRAEAEVARAAFGAPVPDAGALEVLAGLVEIAPSAARRARAILDPRRRDDLDAVDRLVVGAATAGEGGVALVTPGAAGDFRPGCGLDHTNRTMWLPDGRRVDFSRNELWWSFLSALERHGGAASKEELAREVWGVAKYHRLRDDKRMHVAVRRMRTSIEDLPSEPRRLVTTADGYGFGSVEPVRRLGKGTE